MQAFRIVKTTPPANDSGYCSLIDCFTVSHDVGLVWAGTGLGGGFDTIRVIGCVFVSDVGIEVHGGYMIANGNEFHANGVGINLLGGCTGSIITGNQFVGTTTPFVIGNNPAWNTIRDNDGYNPIGPDAPTVGASPWVYTAGSTAETHYIWSGTVSSLDVNGRAIFYNSAGMTVHLEPGEYMAITYSSVPTVVRMRH